MAIKDILIISTPRDIGLFKDLLGDGMELGINFKYAIQDKPRGLADAFIVGEKFIDRDNVALVLGDNIFYEYGFSDRLKKVVDIKNGATIFVYHVSNPSEFGVVEFDDNFNVISLEKKPLQPKSNYAVLGLYFYDNSVVKIAKSLKSSERGEIGITAINNKYLKRGNLRVELFGGGMAWLDTGMPSGLLNAANFVEAVQTRKGLYVVCIEEVAYREGVINKEKLLKLAKIMKKTEYGRYLMSIANE